MLSEARKITIEQKAKIGEKEVIGFRAVFSDGGDVIFLPYQIDKEACKENRKEIRQDQADFEDAVYQLQEEMFGTHESEGKES